MDRGKLIGRYAVDWRVLLALAMGTLGSGALQGMKSDVRNPLEMVAIVASVALIMGVVLWVATRIWCTCLYTNGIRGCTIFGGRPFMRWKDITRVEWLEGGICLSSAEFDMRVPGELAKNQAFVDKVTMLLGEQAEFVRVLLEGPPLPTMFD